MKKLEKHTFKTKGRRSNIDWDQVLDGSIWHLEEGVDFTSKPASVRASAQQAAKQRGLKAKVDVLDDAVVIQAIEPDSE